MAPPTTDMAVQIGSPTDAYRVPQKKQRMEQDVQFETGVRTQKPAEENDPKRKLQELASAVDDMNNKAQNLQRSLQFSVEKELNLTVVKVINPDTDEVVRQIPSEEFIAIARAFEETRSLLFDAEV